jgi:hypothetical protein
MTTTTTDGVDARLTATEELSSTDLTKKYQDQTQKESQKSEEINNISEFCSIFTVFEFATLALYLTI